MNICSSLDRLYILDWMVFFPLLSSFHLFIAVCVGHVGKDFHLSALFGAF